MAGFFSPSLGFASTIGAAIGGAAQQENHTLEQEQAQGRQNDVLDQAWSAQANKAIGDYQEAQNRYKSILNATGGDTGMATAALQYLPKNAKPGDFNDAIAMAKNYVKPGSNDQPDFSRYTNTIDFYKNRIKNPKYLQWLPEYQQAQQKLEGQQGASPFGGSSSPAQGSQGQQPSSAPLTDPGQQQTGTTPNGTSIYSNTGTIGEETPLDTPSTSTGSIPTSTPSSSGQPFQLPSRTRPMSEFERARLEQEGKKLDPVVQSTLGEFMKNIPNVPAESRQSFMDSINEARKSGDVTKVRTDLIPSQSDIDNAAATRAAGIEGSKDYAKDLSKRRGQLDSMRAMVLNSDRIAQMVSDPNDPLRASAAQPLIDQVNRFFNAAGVDLKSTFGLPANKIENVNMLKKVFGDMTFNQIAQYHLGRWTNYEVGILKDKLPSIDTDPNSMIKVSLLFKNAAQRELESYAEESKIAYGQHGENFFNPKDLGKAAMYGASRLTQEPDKLPWLQVTANNQQDYQALPKGSWYELPSGQMGRRGMFLLPGSLKQ